MNPGGTEIKCPACGEIFLFRYGMSIKMSALKCDKCGTHLWDQAVADALEDK
jgi:predicted RNA-binding Zn-ribbon protein involved in translation (DUF1610 family)